MQKYLNESHLYWHHDLTQNVEEWIYHSQYGPKPLANRTIDTYLERFRRGIRKLSTDILNNEKVNISDLHYENLYRLICSIPPESYSERHNMFSAFKAFTRWLSNKGKYCKEELLKLGDLKPRRVIPAKKTHLKNDHQRDKLAITIERYDFASEHSYLTTKSIICTLVNTGLRNSELCNLNISDIDLFDSSITINRGKGNKKRIIGMSQNLRNFLEEYLDYRNSLDTDNDSLFVNKHYQQYNNKSLSRLVKKISDNSGVDITAHGLRRTFATMNADNGQPLNLIQMALGHKHIMTTQEYIMSDDRTLIKSMNKW